MEMTRKLAIFVEGMTELGFVEKLIGEIAGAQNIAFDKRRIVGGSRTRRQVISIESAQQLSEKKFYVLLYDCGGDHQVKPRIVEEHSALTRAGYSAIIGLRDVRPNTAREEIPLLERNLKYGIKTALVPVEIILAVMEIEAWFLAEFTHFSRIDPSIDIQKISDSLGFNPELHDVAFREQPASDLDLLYRIAGKRYSKPAELTIGTLDYSKIYVELALKIPSLGKLVNRIDAFLAPIASG